MNYISDGRNRGSKIMTLYYVKYDVRRMSLYKHLTYVTEET